MMALSMRGHSVFISDIRNCQNIEQESLRIDKKLGNICTKFKIDMCNRNSDACRLSTHCQARFPLVKTFSQNAPLGKELPLSKICEYVDLHNVLVHYGEALALQKAIVKEKKYLIERNEECPDTLIMLQHPPVYTLGTGSSEEFLNFNMEDSPYDVIRTERGGEVTYHGPGQLVMYPIINLRNHKKDLHWYLRALEEVVIRALFSTFSIEASRLKGFTGVWVGNQKLSAIGIRVSQWIAYYGLALNVSVDLTPFRQIVPCGIRDREVGSIKQLLGEVQASHHESSMDQLGTDDSLLIDMAQKSLVQEFSEVFQLKLEQVSWPTSYLWKKENPSSYV